jgi:hypothetical protein
MALHTKKEFAALCGLPTKNLATYIGRTTGVHVVVGKNDLIDDTNPANAHFLKRRQGLRKTGDPRDLPADSGEKVTKTSKKGAKSEKNGTKPENADDMHGLNMRKVALDIEQKEQEKQIRDAQIQKLHGKLVPTDQVKALFSMHFRNVTVSFNQAINVIISEMGQKAKLNVNQLAEVRHAATKAINNAVETSTENSKKDLQNLVDEYSASLKGKAA